MTDLLGVFTLLLIAAFAAEASDSTSFTDIPAHADVDSVAESPSDESPLSFCNADSLLEMVRRELQPAAEVYGKLLRGDSTLGGKIVLEIDLDSAGAILGQPRIMRQTIDAPDIIDELRKSIGTWPFADVCHNTKPFTVTLPLSFASAGDMVRAVLLEAFVNGSYDADAMAKLGRTWVPKLRDAYVRWTAFEDTVEGEIQVDVRLGSGDRVVYARVADAPHLPSDFIRKINSVLLELRAEGLSLGSGAQALSFGVRFENLRGPLSIIDGAVRLEHPPKTYHPLHFLMRPNQQMQIRPKMHIPEL